MRFRLIDAAKKEFPVQRLCKVLDVSPSGYFAWKTRPASRRQREDLVLLAHVRSAFSLWSCPWAWCSSLRATTITGLGREDQAARVGRLTRGSSPIGAMLSRVM